MALVPALDTRPDNRIDFRGPDHAGKALPHDIDAEHALIGCVLVDNEVFYRCEDIGADHFYEPTHGRIWAVICDRIGKRMVADVITVADRLIDDAGLAELGGRRFIADLFSGAPPSSNAADYAALVIDAATRRRLILMADALSAAARAREGDRTARDLVEQTERSLMGMTTVQRRTRLVTAQEAALDVLAYLDAPEAENGGVMTGLQNLDEHLGSLLPDDLVLVCGRPGMGKSALAACIALNVARTGLGVIEINSEMSTAQMMRRHLTDISYERWGSDAPTYKDIRRRRITPSQRGMLEWAVEKVSTLPLMSIKRTGLTLSSLRSLVRRQVAAWSAEGITLGLITVDHVGLLQADGGGKDRYTDQTNIAIGMKALADELHIPVIALVQLSRKVEDRESKRPMLSDLRDSGAWEENADTVIGTFREAYYANKEPEPKDDGRSNSMLRWQEWDRRRKSREIEAILLKVREGEEGVVNLWASIGHNAIRATNPDNGGFL